MKKLFNILIILMFSFLTTVVTGSWTKINASPSFITQEEEESMDTGEEEMGEEEEHSEEEEQNPSDEMEEEPEEKSEDTEEYHGY